MPLAERQLISRIRKLTAAAYHPRGTVVAGIGDDCAVLRIPPRHELLVTTDFSLEGVHFRRDWHPPQLIGHRCLTRGLSDIAAMGGEPLAAFLSLALPAHTPLRWLENFLQGLLNLAKTFEVPLAGGDTTTSPAGVLADIVLLGSVPKGKAILRSGARPGDRIYVTGALGDAAAEVSNLYRNPRVPGKSAYPSFTIPQPRIAVGRVLRQRRIAAAMIDISDGLSTDLSHICEASGVGAEVWASALPLGRFHDRPVDLAFALHGGDAYELLFTARKQTRVPASIMGIVITEIGQITAGRTMMIVQPNGRRRLQSQGWEPFQQASRK